jgi:S1-C subfamily serine protease
MVRKPCSLILVAVLLAMLAPVCSARNSAGEILKQQERYTISLNLEFSKKAPSALQRVISILDWGPNGYATGFLVGDGLVMTAYHVVSGEITDSKKVALGFARGEELNVKVFVNNCQAKVIRVDKDADLALLSVCGFSKTKAPAFQTILRKDEKLFMIARPHGERIVTHGVFYGPYNMRGQEFWSVKIDARDGFSGSPVYNERAELVGVLSGYDWSQKLALISPGAKAQKLLADYVANPTP